MPLDVTLLSAFLVGLLGSTHCVGMCGGIVGALTLGVPAAQRSRWALLPYMLAYNIGRIGSYALAGAILGFISAQLFHFGNDAAVHRIGVLISAAFMILLGLYFTDLWRGLSAVERAGGYLWKRIEPFGRALLPVNHPGKALLFGAVWGWLPCGLVYSTLAWSLASGGPGQGALLMASFGLGTLPMLLVMGTAARWLHESGRFFLIRRVIGWLLILLGLYLILWSGGTAGHIH